MGVDRTPDDFVSDHDKAELAAAAAEQAARLARIGDGTPVEPTGDTGIKTADVAAIIRNSDPVEPIDKKVEPTA